MNTDILIVTHAPDAWWLERCLLSVRKYAKGFSRVVVVHPDRDEAALREICQRFGADAAPIDEPMGKGHLAQNLAKCMADTWAADAKFVLHMDADSVFTEPAIPEDYFVRGKPILWRRSYQGLFAQTTGAWRDAFRCWQRGVQRALGWPEEWEMMARFPIVHDVRVYAATRARVERMHGMPFDQYVLGQPCEMRASGARSVQPGFCEFNTLGSVALHEMPGAYEILTIPDDVHLQGLPSPWPGAEPWALEPRPRMRQFYSHELRSPGGVSASTLAELRSYGLDP